MSGALRVLQVNSIFQGGGVDSQTLELCHALAGENVEVTLAVPENARLRAAARAIPGLKLVTLTGGKLGAGLRLARLIRKRRIDLVHAHHGRDYWVAALAARLGGIGSRCLLSRHLMTPLSSASARYLPKLAHFAAASQAVLRGLHTQCPGYEKRLHLLYGGIDCERFSPAAVAPAGAKLRAQLGWDADHIVFAAIGWAQLPEGKGQLLFLDAAARLRERLPKARFLIAGDGSLMPALRARVQHADLAERVAFIPFQEDIAPVYGTLDVLVHPALGSEALGLVLWEALSCGKPVIASRLDGIPEAFVENEHGMMIPPRDVAALTEAMGRLGGDAALRARLGQAGRAHVCAQFDRRHYARRARALYGHILEAAA
ncbi:MAG: glycosyltransferase [Sinobacteraceae bacterium]|nr:glycosyltransferase [Nevskiaceae bacterium]